MFRPSLADFDPTDSCACGITGSFMTDNHSGKNSRLHKFTFESDVDENSFYEFTDETDEENNGSNVDSNLNNANPSINIYNNKTDDEDDGYLKKVLSDLCRDADQLDRLPKILKKLEEKGYLRSAEKNSSKSYRATSSKDESDDDKDKENLPMKMDNMNDEQISQYYTVICELGSGSYGKVTKIQNMIDKQFYALKTINVNKEEAPFAFREIQALALINSPRVVRYYCAWIRQKDRKCCCCGLPCDNKSKKPENSDRSTTDNDDNDDDDDDVELNIQMEYVSGQNLNEYMQTRTSVDYKYCLYVFHELAVALKEIHKYGVVHRDFSPSNIILKSDGGLTVIDFGISSLRHTGIYESPEEGQSFEPRTNSFTSMMATAKSKRLSNFAIDAIVDQLEKKNHFKTVQELGTPPYTSPHQACGGKSKTSDDIFSLGIIIFELFMNFQTGMERARTIAELKNSHIVPTPFHRQYPKISQLILDMTGPDARKRPSASQVSHDAVFNEIQDFLNNI